ncbi:MAG TPA: calcium-binding protein [Caulobacteraceae bacterium]|jgi:hypothetical protein
MTSFIVTSGTTDTHAKSLGGGDTGVVQANGVLSDGAVIVWTGGTADQDTTIDNAGLITGTKRAIDSSGTFATGGLTIDNHAGATITSSGADAIRMNTEITDGTITVDNAGTINAAGSGGNNGQAIDFANLTSTSTSVHVHIINEAGGLITAADADAIRGGENTVIDNDGTIISHAAAGDSGNDGIDYQGNGGGIVNNGLTGVVDGARHGITGDDPITITNHGSITGELGSGVNMDTAATSMSVVTNTGTITGHGGFLGGDPTQPVDGDGVDIDGLITLKNSGTITAAGVHVDGELQEAVTVGGGEIDNYAGGVITSFERAITVDDSNGGAAFASTTIYNEGLIHGGDGQAISITGDFADTITNKGVIEGSITTGGGDDVFNAYAGSSVTGPIDLGGASNTLNLMGDGHGAIGHIANVGTVNFDSGSWTLGLDSHFNGTIHGFSNLDTLDLAGVGLASSAHLGANGVLTVSGGVGGAVALQLDPHQSFAGYVFQLSSDGMGGTDVTIAKVINGGNGNETLMGTAGNDLISGGNGNDAITSGDGNDSLSGGNGNDLLTAGNGNSMLDGGNGNDVLIAGNGNSTLSGGNGDDLLQVGTGNNILTGGNGDDSFVFGPTFGQDVITDFKPGADHIAFEGAFANFAAVHAAMHQVGGNTVIEMDATHEITLMGVSMASLHASDFMFH